MERESEQQGMNWSWEYCYNSCTTIGTVPSLETSCPTFCISPCDQTIIMGNCLSRTSQTKRFIEKAGTPVGERFTDFTFLTKSAWCGSMQQKVRESFCRWLTRQGSGGESLRFSPQTQTHLRRTMPIRSSCLLICFGKTGTTTHQEQTGLKQSHTDAGAAQTCWVSTLKAFFHYHPHELLVLRGIRIPSKTKRDTTSRYLMIVLSNTGWI